MDRFTPPQNKNYFFKCLPGHDSDPDPQPRFYKFGGQIAERYIVDKARIQESVQGVQDCTKSGTFFFGDLFLSRFQSFSSGYIIQQQTGIHALIKINQQIGTKETFALNLEQKGANHF